MKGIILAGGNGTRLGDLTKISNKHLLPVWDKPMIYYPIQTLINQGIYDIMIVTGGNWAGGFLQLLGNGKKTFGDRVNLHYTYQEGAGGIPDALKYARDFSDGDNVCVILGDNVFDPKMKNFATDFTHGGKILLKEVSDPNRFGVAVLEYDDIINIVEKPKQYISSYAITGIYCFDNRIWNLIDNLKQSLRGELEITDIHRYYLDRKELQYQIFDGFWSDAGTFESLHIASNHMKLLGDIDGDLT
jgi:glucose-1-phosphate thymidylyltransferase